MLKLINNGKCKCGGDLNLLGSKEELNGVIYRFVCEDCYQSYTITMIDIEVCGNCGHMEEPSEELITCDKCYTKKRLE